jgi:hypothetical protein
MNGDLLHNRQIINGVSSIWPVASANSTITQATGNTTVFVFQYDATRITDRYRVWKANASALTPMLTSSTTITQPSISQWQVNGDNISACGMDVAEVIFWNNYQTSVQIDVWTNTLLEEYGARISGASYERIQAPTAGDDRNSGHRLGSQWFDTTNDKAYVCIDDAAGVAVWKETTKEILNDLNDVTITTPAVGNVLRYLGGQWVNRAPNDGQIKTNSFNTNVTTNNLITLTAVTTEQSVVYRITGQTTTALNLSAFPTTSPALNYAGTFTPLTHFYTLGAAADGSDDRFVQNQVLGQVTTYRIEGSYSGKSSANSGRIQFRIFNPSSSFSYEVSVPLAQGLTADDFGVLLTTISDSANLLPPLGTGTGYRISVSSTTSLDISIASIVRIDSLYSDRS